ncbi:hypothetical protein [Candidatus Methylobacter oryzae]|uniref:DUF4340 domain-containing protein n=1 Tax=Candidatus Methylobacter oryzae TaxID=2497749 RepID=A0ABY3CBH2_9GAMM|nr:hypothetical protein [Candidatus Methylobacter oryzae]TRW96457.1 hypothetical protein EKO24_008420 [Candidatus Methylobacter oryzae]
MPTSDSSDVFSQIHIDVARNATDDFNLFHDRNRWLRINRNPFNGPIALGFQVESLLEHKVFLHRKLYKENKLIRDKNLRFSNYQFSFVNAVKPGQVVSVDIKPSKFKEDPETILSNRITVKSDGELALLGYKTESKFALFLTIPELPQFGALSQHPDRSFIAGSSFFLKRKYITTSNAKNFLCGSLVDQDAFFDPFKNKVVFPEIFPCSLISSALLEKAVLEKHDFERNPLVYMSHKISIDRSYLTKLKSGEALYILIRQIPPEPKKDGIGSAIESPYHYECYGLMEDKTILYRALISLAPLEQIVNTLK